MAQSTNSDWSGNAQFKSTYDQSIAVSIADMQKRADGGYYNSFSLSQAYNTTNNVQYLNSGNNINSLNNTNSTSVGSQNNVFASNNNNTSIVAGSTNSGCANASITSSSGPLIAGNCGGH